MKAPSPSTQLTAVTQSINSLTLALNGKSLVDPRGFRSESINYVHKKGDYPHRAESVNPPADPHNTTNAFQSKLNKIFRNRY